MKPIAIAAAYVRFVRAFVASLLVSAAETVAGKSLLTDRSITSDPDQIVARVAEFAPAGATRITLDRDVPLPRAIKLIGDDVDEVLFVTSVTGARVAHLKRPTGFDYPVGTAAKVIQ